MFKKSFVLLFLSSLVFIGCTLQPKQHKDFTEVVTIEKLKKIHTKPEKEKVFERRYELIPPVISHDISNMESIAKNTSSCLECHTQNNKKLASHFSNNEIKPNLYNCLSCHTQSN
jgi:nitrate reductase cytochrome c-type subunit